MIQRLNRTLISSIRFPGTITGKGGVEWEEPREREDNAQEGQGWTEVGNRWEGC